MPMLLIGSSSWVLRNVRRQHYHRAGVGCDVTVNLVIIGHLGFCPCVVVLFIALGRPCWMHNPVG